MNTLSLFLLFFSSFTIFKLRNQRNSTGYWLGLKRSVGPCDIVDVNGNCATVAKFDHQILTKKSKELDFLGKIWTFNFLFGLVNQKTIISNSIFLRIFKDAKATKTAVWPWLILDAQILQLVFKVLYSGNNFWKTSQKCFIYLIILNLRL